MTDGMDRRTFVRNLGLAGATLASGPQVAQAQTQGVGGLTLAFVGTHHIHAPSYAERLHAMEGVKIKYVWDPDPKRAQEWATRLGAAVAKTPEEVWADPQVRGAAICSETNLHHRLVIGAAKAGKHLFVEKPLGVAGREAREMAQAIEQAGVVFTTGYFMRTSPQHRFLKEQIDKGTLGKITRARAENCHSGSLGGWFDTEWRWMADPKVAGGGGFLDLGTHMLDILMWLLGDVESVTADIKVVTGRYGKCDETGEALIRFKNGVTGSLVAGWVDVANPVTLEIYGTEGHATIFDGLLYLSGGKGLKADGREPWNKLPPGLPQPLDQWLAAVGGKTGLPLVPARDAAARVGVMEAMYRAAADHKWMPPL
jgi:predicted dehydrogenase